MKDSVIEEIIDAVCRLDNSSSPTMQAEGDPTLAGGLSGQLLALASMPAGKLHLEGRGRGRARRDQLVEMLERHPLSAGFYQGFTGVAWSLKLLDTLSLGWGPPLDASFIDELLLEHVRVHRRRMEYDLVSGLVGIGVYAQAFHDDPLAAQLLSEIVSELADRWDGAPEGGFLSRPATVLKEIGSPDGVIGIGMAHGLAGVVSFLASVCSASPKDDAAQHLLDQTAHALWMVSLTASRDATIPPPAWIRVHDQSAVPATRDSWCYGSPGISIALLRAGQVRERTDWTSSGTQLMMRVAERFPTGCGLLEPGLCHGMAGLLLLAHTAYTLTQCSRFLDLAVDAESQLLRMRLPDVGVAGFWTFNHWQERDPRTTAPDPGWLSGATGVAFALCIDDPSTHRALSRALLLE